MIGTIRVNQLSVTCIIGCCDEERVTERQIIFDLCVSYNIERPAQSDHFPDAIDYVAVADLARQVATEGRFHILEALANAVADKILDTFGADKVFISISKPGAIAHAHSSGIELTKEACKR